MKVLSVCAFIFLCFSVAAVGQEKGNALSAAIGYDTVRYDRVYGDGNGDHRIVLPRVRLDNGQAATAINEALSFEAVTGYSAEVMGMITYNIEAKNNGDAPVAQGADEEEGSEDGAEENGVAAIVPYVHKNGDGMLSIELQVTEVAAVLSASEGFYPERHYFFNFDLASGNLIFPDSLVKRGQMPRLLHLYHKAAAKHFRRAARAYGREAAPVFAQGFLPDTTYETERLQQFYITDKGLCFYYDYGFMHCDAGVAPDPVLCMPKRKLKRLLVRHRYGL